MIYSNKKILDSIRNFKEYFGHEYDFLPVATEDELISFEKKFNVKLPIEYRWFLLNVANGIENKDEWGLNFIDKIDFKNYWYQEDEYNPSIPFKLDKKIIIGEIEDIDDYPYEVEVITVNYDDDNDDDGYDSFLKGYRNGNVTISPYGCGTVSFLVINGKEFGNIWIDNYSSNQEVYPEYDLEKNKKRLNFNDYLLKRIEWEIKLHNLDLEAEKRREVEEKRIQEEKRRLEDHNTFYKPNIKKDDRNFIIKFFDKLVNW